jgi:hypothetical protein
MRNATSTTRIIGLLLTLGALIGCREQVVSNPLHASAERRQQLESTAFCGMDWELLGLGFVGDAEIVDGRVLAGFGSNFAPGRQPIPCNRLKRARVQGQFQFTALIDPGFDGNIRTAFLEVVSFEPLMPIEVTEARPWGTGVSGGWSGETRNRCRFKVKSFTNASWVSVAPGSVHPWQETRDLAISSGSQIWAPVVRPVLINVTKELRDSVNEGGGSFRLQLAIEPDDRAASSQATNRCIGRFEMRLKLLGAE